MPSDLTGGTSWQVKELGAFALRSCVPGLLGATVCVLPSLVMMPLGFDVFFDPAVPESADRLFEPAVTSASMVASGVRGRFAFGLAAIALLLTAVGVALVTRLVLNAVLGKKEVLNRPVLLVSFGGAVIAFLVSFVPPLVREPSGMLTFLFAKVGSPPARTLLILIATLNALTVAVVVLLGVAFSLLSGPVAAGARRASELANRLSLLRVLLFLASACLVTRVVQVYALYAWPASQLLPSAPADSIALSASAANGAIYSIFLASLYLPAAAMLERAIRDVRIDEVDKPGKPPTAGETSPLSVDQTLVLYGVPGGAVKDFGRVLALLSPVLVGLLQGPLLAIVQKVAGGGGP